MLAVFSCNGILSKDIHYHTFHDLKGILFTAFPLCFLHKTYSLQSLVEHKTMHITLINQTTIVLFTHIMTN